MSELPEVYSDAHWDDSWDVKNLPGTGVPVVRYPTKKVYAVTVPTTANEDLLYEATDMSIEYGALALWIGSEMVVAFAPGYWTFAEVYDERGEGGEESK